MTRFNAIFLLFALAVLNCKPLRKNSSSTKQDDGNGTLPPTLVMETFPDFDQTQGIWERSCLANGSQSPDSFATILRSGFASGGIGYFGTGQFSDQGCRQLTGFSLSKSNTSVYVVNIQRSGAEVQTLSSPTGPVLVMESRIIERVFVSKQAPIQGAIPCAAKIDFFNSMGLEPKVDDYCSVVAGPTDSAPEYMAASVVGDNFYTGQRDLKNVGQPNVRSTCESMSKESLLAHLEENRKDLQVREESGGKFGPMDLWCEQWKRLAQ